MTAMELAKYLTNIDTRLIEQAGREPEQVVRRIRPLRVALIAAAVVVLLLTTVLAVNEDLREQLIAFGQRIIGVEQEQSQTEETAELETQAPEKLRGWVLEGELLKTKFLAFGNLFPVKDGYMTLTPDGLAPVEVTHVDTMLDIYGQWELELDYAVLEEGLAIYNHHIPNDEGTALARPFPGSRDTVILTIHRFYENPSAWYYPVLYNLETGEISDPLAETELLSQGSVDTIEFSEDMEKFIVHTYSETQHDDRFYLGNMEDGTLHSIKSMAGTEGWQQCCFWVDHNHLCMEEVLEHENQQFSILVRVLDTDTGEVVYSFEDDPGSVSPGVIDQQRYCNFNTGDYRYRDMLTGEIWGGLPESETMETDQIPCDSEKERYDFVRTRQALYLVDRESHSWVDLNLVLYELPEEVLKVNLLGDTCLAVGGNDQNGNSKTMFYRVEEITGWNPLTRQE